MFAINIVKRIVRGKDMKKIVRQIVYSIIVIAFVFCYEFFVFSDWKHAFFRMFSLHFQYCICACQLFYHDIQGDSDSGF